MANIACSAEARNNDIEKRGIMHEKYKNLTKYLIEIKISHEKFPILDIKSEKRAFFAKMHTNIGVREILSPRYYVVF